MGEPGDTCGSYCGRLAAREPVSVPVLDVLHRRGTLHARSGEDGRPVARSLLRVLSQPRARGLDPPHHYRGLLERHYNPAGNTQIVNV
jgi:hypothetical protein